MIARYHGEKLNDYVIESLVRELDDSVSFFDETSYLLRVGWIVAHRLMQESIYVESIYIVAAEKRKLGDYEDCNLNREN